MQYRQLKDGTKVSLLGFGCMRFPMLNGTAEVDRSEAIRLLRRAIDSGVNYIDTAWPYHQGESERIVGEALKDGYRERVLLVSKLPLWLCEKESDFDRYLNEQLEKLQTDHLDLYLLHSLDKEQWEKGKKLKVCSFLDKALADGRIRRPAFSFHDEYPVFEEILLSYDWSMAQIMYNILDEDFQAGKRGFELAVQRGVDVVVMEPLRGGSLAQPIADIKSLYEDAEKKRSAVEWCFRWLTRFSGIKTILSGMSDQRQLDENLRIFSEDDLEDWTEADDTLIGKAQAIYKEKIKLPCTGCEYCQPCPANVRIPQIFTLLNHMSMFAEHEKSKKRYKELIREKQDASACVACGQCEAVCPQHIPVIEALKEAAGELSE